MRFEAPLAALLTLLIAVSAYAADPPKKKKRKAPPHLVELTQAKLVSIGTEAEVLGSLRHRRTVRIFNQEEGRVARLPYFEGDSVKQDDTLVAFDQTLMRAQLAKAIATRKQATLDLERQQALAKRKLAADDAIARARTALDVARSEETVLRTRIGYATIKAPFDGVVTARLVEPGDAVGKHAHLLTLADPKSLLTTLTVSELLIPQLRIGDDVAIRIDALGHQNHPGNIVRIHPEIDPSTRTGIVEAELKPAPLGARAGQFVRVKLVTHESQRLLLPFAAIRRDREGEYVFKLGPKQRVRRMAVSTGLRFDNRVAVLDGLNEGDAVVLRGFLGLREGKTVQIVETSQQAPVETTPSSTVKARTAGAS